MHLTKCTCVLYAWKKPRLLDSKAFIPKPTCCSLSTLVSPTLEMCTKPGVTAGSEGTSRISPRPSSIRFTTRSCMIDVQVCCDWMMHLCAAIMTNSFTWFTESCKDCVQLLLDSMQLCSRLKTGPEPNQGTAQGGNSLSQWRDFAAHPEPPASA